MSDLTLAEVLEILVGDLGETGDVYLKLKDRLYQHLNRHPDFANKENNKWFIPEKRLKEIAYWAIKSPPEKRTNKNLMVTSQMATKLQEMERGQMSTAVNFSLELFFSLFDGEEPVENVAKKLRLFCRLHGVQGIDERLRRLAA
jgi:hypothetical protein